MTTKRSENDVFLASLVTDIKTYSGNDPLLPWLRGIKRMKESLPPKSQKEKLPRFLQKCTHTFETDRRYKNDLRFLRVWLHLMDYVDEPRALLERMERNRIGLKRSLFYQAYALYYEKMKKFDEAESMYHLGVQNLAEPAGELENSHQQFLLRMEKHKIKKIQQRGDVRIGKRPLSVAMEINDENKQVGSSANTHSLNQSNTTSSREWKVNGDDTVVVKFVDTAIVGKLEEIEDACHHGLVDPTINMKEAMNDINNMFREPIETSPLRKSRRSQPRVQDPVKNKGFQIFVDNDDNAGQNGDGFDENESSENRNGFVFTHARDAVDSENSPRGKPREDTVVRRFVGSTILDDESEVENVCHHGLVDPTINLKQAMDDINDMFGKPIDFVRTRRSRKDKAPIGTKQDSGGFSILPDDAVTKQGPVGFSILPDDVTNQGPSGFSILPDDDLDCQQDRSLPPPLPKSCTKKNVDLFEPTLFTKEAMHDINKMFGMPLDF